MMVKIQFIALFVFTLFSTFLAVAQPNEASGSGQADDLDEFHDANSELGDDDNAADPLPPTIHNGYALYTQARTAVVPESALPLVPITTELSMAFDTNGPAYDPRVPPVRLHEQRIPMSAELARVFNAIRFLMADRGLSDEQFEMVFWGIRHGRPLGDASSRTTRQFFMRFGSEAVYAIEANLLKQDCLRLYLILSGISIENANLQRQQGMIAARPVAAAAAADGAAARATQQEIRQRRQQQVAPDRVRRVAFAPVDRDAFVAASQRAAEFSVRAGVPHEMNRDVSDLSRRLLVPTIVAVPTLIVFLMWFFSFAG